jgi:hypothetical protein
MNEDWLFANPFGTMAESNQSSGPHAGREHGLGQPLFSETLGKSNSDLFNFITSNFPVAESFSQPSPNDKPVRETLPKNSPAGSINVSAGLESTRTPAASPSKLIPSVKIESPEGYTNKRFFNVNAVENFGDELLKYEDVLKARPVEGNTSLTTSTDSNHSSQSSSPSLSSSSSSNSRSSSHSPCHSSIDLNTFNEPSTFFQNLNTLFAKDFGNQHCYAGSADGLFNVGTQPNPLNPIPNDKQLGLESFYPLQHHIQQQQQQLLQQLQLQQSWPQDSWTQGFQQPIPEIDDFINATLYPDALSANFQTPAALKPIFICPKCGKGHTRQSNLLAHLRDTHSQVKKGNFPQFSFSFH